MMLAPSAKVPVRWPSAISLSDSSHGAGNRGSLSPSLPRVGELNIFRAAETGDVEVMLTYLNGGGEPNKTGKKGYSVLHLAAMRNQGSMVELLLQRGADPDAHDLEEGLTPLMWAAQLGYTEVAAALLKGGAGTEEEDLEDLTALHWAARLGQESLVHLLLDHTADVEAVDYDGNTPLIWAAREGHRGCVNILLDNEASTRTPDENGNTALHFSCQNGHSGITSDLLDWGALVTAQDYWQFTPFHRACSQGHGDVLVELLRARAPEGAKTTDGRRKGEGARGFGSGIGGGGGGGGGGNGGKRRGGGRRGDESLFPTLGLPSEIIDLRNHFQATPLHRAAAKGHEEVVSMLVQNGANVNSRDGFFYTPLHLACVNGAVACVDVLLRSGADPTTRAQGGVTPLLAARKPEVRELLNNFLPAWSASDVVAASYAGVDRGGVNGGGPGDERGGAAVVPARGVEMAGVASAVSVVGEGESQPVAPAADTTTVPKGGAVKVRSLPVCAAAAAAAAGSEQPPVEGGGLPSPTAMEVCEESEPLNVDRAMGLPVAAASGGGAGHIERGRPMSRLPKDEAAVRRRLRRSSTGSMLQKVFSNPQFPTWPSGEGVDDVSPTGLAGPTRSAFLRNGRSISVGVPAAAASAAASATLSSADADAASAAAAAAAADAAAAIAAASAAATAAAAAAATAAAATADADAATAAAAAAAAAAVSTATPTTAQRTAAAATAAVAPVATPPRASNPQTSFPPLFTDLDDLSSVPSAAPPRRNLARLTVKNPDLFRGRRRLSDAGTEAGVAAAVVAAAALATAVATAAAAAAAGAGAPLAEGERRAFRKRRARSLPPCWEGDEEIARRRKGGEQPRPPRRPRLESRPCMDGPAAVIANLALDEAKGDDVAWSCWMQGMEGRAGGGDSPLPLSSALVPLRRATTLIG